MSLNFKLRNDCSQSLQPQTTTEGAARRQEVVQNKPSAHHSHRSDKHYCLLKSSVHGWIKRLNTRAMIKLHSSEPRWSNLKTFQSMQQVNQPRSHPPLRGRYKQQQGERGCLLEALTDFPAPVSGKWKLTRNVPSHPRYEQSIQGG